MTDKQQPEELLLASAAESADLVGYPTAKKANAYYLCLLEDCATVIRRQHAELETLNLYKNMADEYGLSIFPDIAEMTTELETLRTGYAAARLEIESLRGQQNKDTP